MVTAWVVDSNAFIHLGKLAEPSIVEDLEKAMSATKARMWIASGVLEEIRTVRFQKHVGRPKVADALRPLLSVEAIEEAEVQGLAGRIGERAAPQDVDLSLMVLAARLAGRGEEVVLVSDDFKMTTSASRIHMPFTTCPPSTWLHRVADHTPDAKVRRNLRGVSRKARHEEMRYAISRAGQYDVQAKLTWLIDSLLTAPQHKAQRALSDAKAVTPVAAEDAEEALVLALRRHVRGDRVKGSTLRRLGGLVEACEPARVMVEHLQVLPKRIREDGAETAGAAFEREVIDAMEELAVGLAPLDADAGHTAMMALAPIICESETTLGILAQTSGEIVEAHRHLSRAGLMASIIDDDEAEVAALFPIGLLAMHSGDHAKASRILQAAAREATKVPAWQLEVTLAAGIAAQMNGEDAVAEHLITLAGERITGREDEAIIELEELAEAFLAVGLPHCALEIYGEALECAVSTGREPEAERLGEALVRCEAQLAGTHSDQVDGLARLRSLLDGVYALAPSAAATLHEHEQRVKERFAADDHPLPADWQAWGPAKRLLGNRRGLEVLRMEHGADEGRDASLAITWHPAVGILGVWIPGRELPSYEVGRQQVVLPVESEVMVVPPPADLVERYGTRALVGLKDPSAVEVVPL